MLKMMSYFGFLGLFAIGVSTFLSLFGASSEIVISGGVVAFILSTIVFGVYELFEEKQ